MVSRRSAQCWVDSVLRRFPQTAFSICFVPLLQQTSQGREKLLLQIVHAAPVELMGLCVLADGQAVYKPLPEIVPVF